MCRMTKIDFLSSRQSPVRFAEVPLTVISCTTLVPQVPYAVFIFLRTLAQIYIFVLYIPHSKIYWFSCF
jgi:hypothetical protein